jgi:hypothetical protein
MPRAAIAALLLIGAFLWIGAAIGCGYWCKTIGQRKGRSPWAGFALGALLGFLETPLAGLAVVGVSYTLTGRSKGPSRRSTATVIALVAVAAFVAFSVVFQGVVHAHG